MGKNNNNNSKRLTHQPSLKQKESTPDLEHTMYFVLLIQTIIAVKENLLCLFGGITGSEDIIKPQSYTNDLFLFDLSDFLFNIADEKYWSVPLVGGYVPTPRYFNSLSCNQNETYGEILVLGGRVQDGNVD